MSRSTETTTYRCPLCNDPVPQNRAGCASGCPLTKQCRILCCPNCGYQFVEESTLISGTKRLFRWMRRVMG